MTDEEISKQLQDQITRLQQIRGQLQMITQQRQQTELKLKEIDDVLEELEKTNENTPIYKSVGAILIKTKKKEEVIKEMKLNKESLEIRRNTLEKQEGRAKEKLNELQSKVQNALNISSTNTQS